MMNKKILLIWEKLIRRSLENFCLRQKFRDDSFVFAYAKNRDNSYFSTPVALVEQCHSELQAKNPFYIIPRSFTTTLACLFRMTLLSLFLILPTKSWADDSGTCGTDCHWSISGDTLTIDGSGKMDDYNHTTKLSPWRDAENFAKVKNVVISGITSIGDYAFWNVTTIKKVTMSDTVTEINTRALAWMNLTELKLSDSLETLGFGAFRNTSFPEFILPAGVSVEIDALGSNQPNIICKGTVAECQNLYEQLENYKYHAYDGTSADIPQDLSQKMKLAGQSNCESSNYYWSGSSCNNKKNGINCDENWKEIETWCNRIRYTPADAAKVLKDTDNTIIMTFKVNR